MEMTISPEYRWLWSLALGGRSEPEHQPIADISRLVADTQWQPKISLQKTLRDTLSYWISRQSAPEKYPII